MSLEIDISDFHEGMLDELTAIHGDEMEDHLRAMAESEIHESYQQLRQ
jgi:hypothetical protein